MNPFLNPITGLPFIKRFLFDPGRLYRSSPEKIEKYRDKALRRILRYAYTVPLYRNKYSAAKVNLQDINGINDITKLPFTTKQDIKDNYPENILPEGYDRDNVEVISTAGSTGKQVSLFTDFSVIAGGIGATVRSLRHLNLSWKNLKLANIGNFNPNMADYIAEKIFYSKIPFYNSKENHLSINAFVPMEDIIAELNEFKPDVIYSYPATFWQLAFLKKKKHGKDVNPKALISSGSVLDRYTRSYVEEAFGCKMFNGYGSVESSGETPIAFECKEGIWHINHDFYHIEAIDENMELVNPGERGHIVVTRMFGKATPIIRYTGMDDWVTLSYGFDCSCGLCTPIFKGGVEGRASDSILLPDGRLFPGASFAGLYIVLNELKTKKVKQFQIVQKKIDEIDILIIIDEDLRNIGPSVDLIFKKIKENHEKKAGSGVEINVKEVKDIPSRAGKPTPLIISKIKPV